jgi:hypothetical protein
MKGLNLLSDSIKGVAANAASAVMGVVGEVVSEYALCDDDDDYNYDGNSDALQPAVMDDVVEVGALAQRLPVQAHC